MQQTPLHFGVVTRISCYYVLVCMNAMFDYIACILNIIDPSHACTWWHSEADENIPTWHSCNNVGPMHKPLDTSRFNSLHV